MLEPLRRSAAIALAVVLLAYEALDALFGPIVRPPLAYLRSLRLFIRLGLLIEGLPAYTVLALLAAPFVAIEPFKFVGLYWMAEGRLATGAATLAAAYLLSFFVSERIFHAGRGKLLTILWFARGYHFVMEVRARALAWVKSTAAWRSAAALIASARAGLARRLSA